MSKTIAFTIDGKKVEAAPGETIWKVAERHGILLPHLCYKPAPGYRPDGNCRACMVEIEGELVLSASCIRTPTPGMKVKTKAERAVKARKMVMELLLADQPHRDKAHDDDSHFWHMVDAVGVDKSRFPSREMPPPDNSHPAISVQLDACIQCGLCTRACHEVQVNDVIGVAFRGAKSKVVFDFDHPMGDSTCVACGECVQACPTGALMEATRVEKDGRGSIKADTRVDSLCPYCGVGCQLTFNVRDGRLLSVEGRNGPANHNRLCVKGRFGFDYVHHPHRLTKPLIRKAGIRKIPDEP
ncbi:MAG TPA: 2Fe-2S iron-sulfur cluster-binding protein, partial [Alphaproteobacteria bacterium]|nr:2Fe-2S iron-sulfur cluster-binding protein [Alphaproteobacteria bacterium]